MRSASGQPVFWLTVRQGLLSLHKLPALAASNVPTLPPYPALYNPSLTNSSPHSTINCCIIYPSHGPHPLILRTLLTTTSLYNVSVNCKSPGNYCISSSRLSSYSSFRRRFCSRPYGCSRQTSYAFSCGFLISHYRGSVKGGRISYKCVHYGESPREHKDREKITASAVSQSEYKAAGGHSSEGKKLRQRQTLVCIILTFRNNNTLY